MPPRRGQDGYAAWCIAEIEAGRCHCPGCGGTLTDPSRSPGAWRFCSRCRCATRVDKIGSATYPVRIPAYGTCPDADRQLAEDNRDAQADMRKRLAAESLGDPQR